MIAWNDLQRSLTTFIILGLYIFWWEFVLPALPFWTGDRCSCSSAHTEVLSVVYSVCSQENAYKPIMGLRQTLGWSCAEASSPCYFNVFGRSFVSHGALTHHQTYRPALWPGQWWDRTHQGGLCNLSRWCPASCISVCLCMCGKSWKAGVFWVRFQIMKLMGYWCCPGSIHVSSHSGWQWLSASHPFKITPGGLLVGWLALPSCQFAHICLS